MTTRNLQIITVLISLLLFGTAIYSNSEFYHDDSYITLRYAQNYIAHQELVWNLGERVQGYTNFLHLILIIALNKIGLDLVRASQVITGLSFISIVAVSLLYLKVTYKAEFSKLWHIPLLLIATSFPLLVWSFGGLESVLFALLVFSGTLTITNAVSNKNTWGFFLAGILFSLSFLARPDGFVFSAFTGLYLIYLTLRKSISLSNLTQYCIASVIVVAPYLHWQLDYYGDIFPNTFYAKAGAPISLKLQNGALYFLLYLLHPPFLIIQVSIAFIYAFSKSLWSTHLSYLLLLQISYLAFVVLIAGGDHMQAFRLILPLIPLWVMSITIIIARRLKDKPNKNLLGLSATLMLFTCLQIFSPFLNPGKEDQASKIGSEVGKYINQNWPKDALIALNTAGSTPYHAPDNKYIDMLGLNDPIIAKREIKTLELQWQRVPGHLKGDGDYVLSRNPDYIILGPAEGSDKDSPWFLSDLEISKNKTFIENYTKQQVQLKGEERETVFTYYQRISIPK